MKTKRKKILIFAVQFYPETSGYSFATTNFVKATRDHYDITVLTPVEKPAHISELSGITVKRASKKGLRKYLYQFKVLPYVVRTLKKWDVIFFDTAEMFILGNIITRLAPQKTMVRFHGCMTTEAAFYSKTMMMKIWKYFIRKWIKRTRIITVTTPFYIDFINKTYLRANLYLSAAKQYALVPNTLFTGEYGLLDKKSVFDKYNLQEDKFTMLTLGRMDKDGLLQKGIEDVLFALHRLKREAARTDFTLVIIGSGDKKTYLENLAIQLNMKNEVIFIPRAKHIEVLSLSKHVDATVLFSRFEGMSMFALESISFGCFPIFSKTGGLIDLVKDNKSGFLVEPKNISQLALTIARTMDMPAADVQLFRKRSVKHFRNNFTPENIAEKFFNAVDFVIE